jgi:hypothetical protein
LINTTSLQKANNIPINTGQVLLEEGGQEDKKAGQRWHVAMCASWRIVLIFSQLKAGPTLADFFLIKQKGKVETSKYNFKYKSIFDI